jgi:hypothetical protein
VRALILIDTQAGPEDSAKMPGYQQMMDIWAKQGLPDPIADTIEQIILGQNWAGSAAWKAKWRTWKPVNLLQCFHTLSERDDLHGSIGQIQCRRWWSTATSTWPSCWTAARLSPKDCRRRSWR